MRQGWVRRRVKMVTQWIANPGPCAKAAASFKQWICITRNRVRDPLRGNTGTCRTQPSQQCRSITQVDASPQKNQRTYRENFMRVASVGPRTQMHTHSGALDIHNMNPMKQNFLLRGAPGATRWM